MSNPLLDTSDLPRFDAIEPQHAVPALEELISAHRQKLERLLDDAAARDFDSLIAPLENMSHEEIAQFMGISNGAIRTRLSRIRQLLKSWEVGDE